MVPDVLIISTKVWNRLTAEEQQWLSDAIRESVEVERKYWAESEAEALEKVIEAGVEINYPDKGPFEERVQQLYDTYKSEPEIYSLIQRIKAVH